MTTTKAVLISEEETKDSHGEKKALVDAVVSSSIDVEESAPKVAKFVKKLVRMMENAQIQVCEWSPGGHSIIFCKGPNFEKLLFEHFHGRNFNSFVRQLHTYGFKQQKLRGKANIYSFNHPNFIRGRPELYGLIKRRTIKRKPGRPALPSATSTAIEAIVGIPLFEQKKVPCDDVARVWRSCLSMRKQVISIDLLIEGIRDDINCARYDVDNILHDIRQMPLADIMKDVEAEVFERHPEASRRRPLRSLASAMSHSEHESGVQDMSSGREAKRAKIAGNDDNETKSGKSTSTTSIEVDMRVEANGGSSLSA